jgi:hypothetical protein
MSHVYNRCTDLGLMPESIASHLMDLIEFSETVPVSKISDYVNEKKNEKDKLEQDIDKLKDEKLRLPVEKAELETHRDSALHDRRITSNELKWHSSLKEELRKHGIPIKDISKFTRMVNGASQYGYDLGRLLINFQI